MIKQNSQSTTQNAVIQVSNADAAYMNATIQTDGSFNVNFNITNADAWFGGEDEGFSNITQLLAQVRASAEAQRKDYVAQQATATTETTPTE